MQTPDTNSQPSQPPQSVAAKRPYAAPRLTVHGTVAELTAAKLTGQRLLAPGYLTEA